MLRFDRKQLKHIGDSHMKQSLRDFLCRHFPEALTFPAGKLDGAIDAILARCRQYGLNTQRGIAAYALACFVFGDARIDDEPALAPALRDRSRPQEDRALLIEIWLTQAWGSFQTELRT